MPWCVRLPDGRAVSPEDAIRGARLRALFAELGWMNLYDVSLGEARKVVFGDRSEEVTFGDGVQVWVNPWI